MASPELATVITMLRALKADDSPDVEKSRATFEQVGTAFPLPADVRCEPVVAGGVPAEWIRRDGAAVGAALLYLHGGGYAVGSINTHRALVATLAGAARIPGLLIDYRRAPEAPFPAAVDDATAAYRWLLAQGIAPNRIAIAGDSAGGGLTIATLVALRDAGTPLPAAGVCFSPWVDLEGVGESMTARAERDPILQKADVLWFASMYLGNTDRRTPLAAPLYADLSGLPPLLVQVGEAETLYDDATRLAERARKAGVDVTLEPWPEMVHVWQIFAPMLPEGREALAAAGRFIAARIGA